MTIETYSIHDQLHLIRGKIIGLPVKRFIRDPLLNDMNRAIGYFDEDDMQSVIENLSAACEKIRMRRSNSGYSMIFGTIVTKLEEILEELPSHGGSGVTPGREAPWENEVPGAPPAWWDNLDDGEMLSGPEILFPSDSEGVSDPEAFQEPEGMGEEETFPDLQSKKERDVSEDFPSAPENEVIPEPAAVQDGEALWEPRTFSELSEETLSIVLEDHPLTMEHEAFFEQGPS